MYLIGINKNFVAPGLKAFGEVIAFGAKVVAFNFYGAYQIFASPEKLHEIPAPEEYLFLVPFVGMVGWYLGEVPFMALGKWLDDDLDGGYGRHNGKIWLVQSFVNFGPWTKFFYLLGRPVALAFQLPLMAITAAVYIGIAALASSGALVAMATTALVGNVIGLVGSLIEGVVGIAKYFVSLNADDERKEEIIFADPIIARLRAHLPHQPAEVQRQNQQPDWRDLARRGPRRPRPAVQPVPQLPVEGQPDPLPQLIDGLDQVIEKNAPVRDPKTYEQLIHPPLEAALNDSVYLAPFQDPQILECGHTQNKSALLEIEDKRAEAKLPDCRCPECNYHFKVETARPHARLADAVDEYGLWKKKHGIKAQSEQEIKQEAPHSRTPSLSRAHDQAGD